MDRAVLYEFCAAKTATLADQVVLMREVVYSVRLSDPESLKSQGVLISMAGKFTEPTAKGCVSRGMSEASCLATTSVAGTTAARNAR